MYDMPALQLANDAFWTAIRNRLGRGPAQLDRTTPLWDIWQSPDLILSQTCGYPYRARLHGNVQLVGTPDYAVPGCPPGHYRSYIIAREGDLAVQNGGCFAFNDALSQSGWAAPLSHMLDRDIRPGSLLATGGHADSLAAVARGHADFAGIDAQTFRLLQQQGALPEGIAIIAETVPTPGLPLICSAAEDAASIYRAVTGAIADRAAELLGIRALVSIGPAAYLAIPTPPKPEQLRLPCRHRDG